MFWYLPCILELAILQQQHTIRQPLRHFLRIVTSLPHFQQFLFYTQNIIICQKDVCNVTLFLIINHVFFWSVLGWCITHQGSHQPQLWIYYIFWQLCYIFIEFKDTIRGQRFQKSHFLKADARMYFYSLWSMITFMLPLTADNWYLHFLLPYLLEDWIKNSSSIQIICIKRGNTHF